MTLSSNRPSAGSTRNFYFVGVTTQGSSMRRIFPRWCEALGLDAALIGVDLPLDASDEQYREILNAMQDDPHAAGGLVTSHKLNLLKAARDDFARLDPDAERLREIACIVKRHDGSLEGSAKDAQTSILALRHIIPEDYWAKTGADVLCLGVGGSGQAFALGLLNRTPPDQLPGRIILVARNESRVEQARAVLSGLPESGRVEYRISARPEETDVLVSQLPAGSLVANATGMGKDTPGSPLTDDVKYPEDGLAWDFNYRGDLLFLDQARRQSTKLGVNVHDGWVYFLYGWMYVLADVFGFEVTPEVFDRLSGVAERYR